MISNACDIMMKAGRNIYLSNEVMRGEKALKGLSVNVVDVWDSDRNYCCKSWVISTLYCVEICFRVTLLL